MSVAEIEQLTPGFTRVVLSGSALADYTDPRPADAFKLILPGDAPEPVLRAFTVRRFDSAAQRLTMDVARHEQGSIDWLLALRPGDTVSLSGMRPEWAVGEGVRDHVLIGDDTAVPAIAAIIESLDASDTVSVYLALSDPADIALVPSHPNLTVRRLGAVTEAAEHTPPPVAAARRAQAWIAAEAGQVRRVRAHVTDRWGIARADLLARAYWKLGTTSTDNDSATLARYQEALAGGDDVYDPELAEDIDLAV
nr:siderophore-interacting protein [Nocardia transvalensis]